MARVAKIGARVVIVDSSSPEDESLDRQWNHMEKLRDLSHVRSYRPSAWRAMVAGAGLRVSFKEVDYCTENGGPLNFAGLDPADQYACGSGGRTAQDIPRCIPRVGGGVADTSDRGGDWLLCSSDLDCRRAVRGNAVA